MAVHSEWATSVAAGAFLLSAVTGVLIFFHIDSGLNKYVLEWLSWVLLGAVALHLVANFGGFKRHLVTRCGQVMTDPDMRKQVQVMSTLFAVTK